MKKLAMKKLSM